MYKNIMIAVALLVTPLACTYATETAPESTQQVRSPGKPLHPLQVKAVTLNELKAGAESEARIIVTSARDFDSMDVTVKPAPGMVIYDERFRRDKRDLVRGELELPLRFRPAADGEQMIEVHVRAVGPDGRVMSRTVKLALGATTSPRSKQQREIRVPDDLPEAQEDAVVKARQNVDQEH